jgi:hypothetical protein
MESVFMGRFIPHPDEVPVELTLLTPECISRQQLHTISLGGIACNYHRAWRHGTALEVRMPTLNPDMRFRAMWPGACDANMAIWWVSPSWTSRRCSAPGWASRCARSNAYCRMNEAHDDLQEVQALALNGSTACRRVLRRHVRKAFAQPVLD